MRIRFVVLSLVVVLGLLATRAGAVQVNFTPSVIVTEEYTDNLFLAPTDEEDDWLTITSLGLALDILGRTAGLQLNYTPSYVWYADFSELDGWRHSADALAYWEPARYTRIEARNTFLRTDDPLQDSEILRTDNPFERPGVTTDRLRRTRNEYYANDANVRINQRFGENDLFYLGGAYRIRREVSPPAGAVTDDNDTYEPFAGLTFWFTPQWGMELEGLYSNRDYEDRDDREEYTGSARLNRLFTRHLTGFLLYEHTYLNYDKEITDRDFHFHLPSVGANYQVDQNTRITASVGYYFQNVDGGSDEEGLIFNSEIFKNWPFQKGNVSLTLLSGYDVEDEGVEDLGLNLYYEGLVQASYSLARRLTGQAYASYRYDDFPNEKPSRQDETISAGLGLTYQPLQWMFLRLAYDFRDLSSDVAADEFTENRGTFTVTIQPDQPFRIFR